ncbi:MAG: lytic transglycosylase domain-containing protein [Bryobacterales bacterium]|nr:lytic transglycosylase domain-containing protein [Bryobacterales bacterium]
MLVVKLVIFAPLAVLLLTSQAWCAEQVVLTSGFRIRADRHERLGARVKLYTANGEIELAADTVQSIEVEEYVAPPPAPPAPPPTPVSPPVAPAIQPKALLDQAAEKYGLPPEFLHSVARIESAYQLNALSPKGAIGLMQLMPGTAAQLNADPHDPLQNVDAGARHLRDLLLQYGGSTHKALAAYNAGAGAVQKYQGVPPYRETRGYVEKVLRNYQRLTQTASDGK